MITLTERLADECSVAAIERGQVHLAQFFADIAKFIHEDRAIMHVTIEATRLACEVVAAAMERTT